MSKENRTLTDEDIEAFWEVIKEDLYINAGKGLFNFAWKLFLAILLILSVYGASHGWFG